MERRGKGRFHEFKEGDNVLIRNYRTGKKWQPGTVACKDGAMSYTIRTEGGLVRKHLDQMLSDETTTNNETNDVVVVTNDGVESDITRTPMYSNENHEPTTHVSEQSISEVPITTNVTNRRSERNKNQPRRLIEEI